MYKRFFICSLSVTLSVLLLLGGLVFAIDPFYHYRCPEDFNDIIYHQTYHQNTGIAQHSVYDTLITGSSMTQNFRADHFDHKTGSKALCLPFEGGTLKDYLTLFDVAIKSNKNLKRIYFGLDNYIITQDSALYSESNRIPDYLVDGKWYTDVNYLLNKDVLFKYIRVHFGTKLVPDYDFYSAQVWQRSDDGFSKEDVIKSYEMPEKHKPYDKNRFLEIAGLVSKELCKRIEDNPEIEFVIFAPPYSILYWYEKTECGNLDATVYALEQVYAKLLKYDNVRFFYFQNNFDMISNLDRYKDLSHYHSDYNEYMLDCFISGENEITKENYIDALKSMKKYVLEYDFEALFNS